MTEREGNNWPVWAKHVLAELKRISEELKEFRDDASGQREKWLSDIGTLRTEIALLKFKCSLFGAGAGIFSGLATELVGRFT